MIFKPRIFISSTLSENLSVRGDIEDFYASIGAEAMLYEKNLTPSAENYTYRKDILEADFIIFIIKENYGTKTESGISGTHEELRISLQSDIPKHVYIQKVKELKDDDAQELRDEINKNNISYFYFSNDDELFNRIKETTFTISKEIMLKKVEEANLPRQSVKKICNKYDFNKAMDIINIYESIMYFHTHYDCDFLDTTLLSSLVEPICFEKQRLRWMFVDKYLERKLEEIIKTYREITNLHYKIYTLKNSKHTFESKILGRIEIDDLRFISNADNTIIRDQLSNNVKTLLNQFLSFKSYVGEQKVESEIIERF